MNNYIQGNTIRVTATFKNASAVVTDPTAITARVKNPAGTTTVYVYLTDVALVKDSTGVYHVDIDISTSGVWSYRFEGTGTVKAADQGQFRCIVKEP